MEHLYQQSADQPIPESQDFADDLTIFASYVNQNESLAAKMINGRITDIIPWGKRWQIMFAPNKTHFIVVSRTRSAIRFYFAGGLLKPQDELDVLRIRCEDSIQKTCLT